MSQPLKITATSQDIVIAGADFRVIGDRLLNQASLVLTDPPYSKYVHEKSVSYSTKAARDARDMGVQERDYGYDYCTPALRHGLVQAAAKTKGWVLFYSDIESMWLWRHSGVAAGLKYFRPLIWSRWSQPQMSGDRPPTRYEGITLFWGGKLGESAWNGPGNFLIEHRALRGKDKLPGEKPLDQMLDLVSYFSNPGELVIDFCGGAGTTALACKILGRRCVTTELNPATAKAAERRVTASSLSERDLDRAERWVLSKVDDVVRKPTKPSEEKTYERFLRRRGDLMVVAARLGGELSLKRRKAMLDAIERGGTIAATATATANPVELDGPINSGLQDRT